MQHQQAFIDSLLNTTESNVYIFELEKDGNVYTSKALQNMLGYREEELKGLGVAIPFSLMHPQDLDKYIKDIKPGYASLAEKEIITHEFRMQDKAGNWHWFKSKESVFLRDNQNVPIQVFGLVENVSENKQLREELLVANQRLSKAEEQASLGSWNIKVGESISIWSEQMFHFFELPVSRFSPDFKTFLELVHPEDRPIILNAQNQMKKGELPESRIYRTNPSVLPLKYLMPSYYMERNVAGTPAKYRGTLMDVTEKTIANIEIERLKSINNAAVRIGKIGYWNWDIKENEIYWSDRMYEIFDIDRNQKIAYEDILNRIHPDDRNDHEEKISNKIISKDNSPIEYRIVLDDGSIRHLLVQLEIISDHTDATTKFQGTVMDVTQSKKAEEAIKHSENQYRTLVEQASDAIFIADGAGRFITVNTSACLLSQCTEAELLQKTIYDFALLEDLQREPFHFSDLKAGKAVNTERVMQTKDGLQIVVEISAKLLLDGRMLVFVRDISERKKVQNEILLERNLSDSIVNSLPGVFYLYDQQGKFLRWNKNLEKVTGYSAVEISKMHPLDFFAGKEKELLKQKISKVFETGEESVQANFVVKSKKRIPYYFTGIAVEYRSETCLLGVGIDFTDLVAAQEKIKITTEQLRRLTAHLQDVREEERKRIGREIHDELGQQLTAIKMDIAWLYKRIGLSEGPIKNKLKNIITLLNGSNESVRKILKELRPGILDDFSLPDALEWQAQQFKLSSGIPVKFINRSVDQKVPILVATCIFRICQESLTNIMRYANASTVQITLEIKKHALDFYIKDDGLGFDTTMMKDLSSFGILGMKERVISLKGIFDLESAPGNGTMIHTRLPLDQHVKVN